MSKKISIKEVKYTAKLARIELNDDEADTFLYQFEDILGFVDQLKDVETQGEMPTSQVTGLKNSIRADVVKKSLPMEDAVNDPSGYFVVPKILE